MSDGGVRSVMESSDPMRSCGSEKWRGDATVEAGRIRNEDDIDEDGKTTRYLLFAALEGFGEQHVDLLKSSASG